jgi:hypothetical protein
VEVVGFVIFIVFIFIVCGIIQYFTDSFNIHKGEWQTFSSTKNKRAAVGSGCFFMPINIPIDGLATIMYTSNVVIVASTATTARFEL